MIKRYTNNKLENSYFNIKDSINLSLPENQHFNLKTKTYVNIKDIIGTATTSDSLKFVVYNAITIDSLFNIKEFNETSDELVYTEDILKTISTKTFELIKFKKKNLDRIL